MSQDDIVSEVLDDLPGTRSGVLAEPEVVDAGDDAAARAAGDGTEVDDSAQARSGARTQQGQMKADVAVAAARVHRAMAREAATDDRINDKVRKFLRTEADGFLQVTRLGPVEMPSIELGVVGQIRHAQLAAMTIADVLGGMVGGGLYQVAAYRGDNSPVEGDVYTVQVVGDPKPKTRAGKAWLAKVSREGTLDEPARGGGDDAETKSMMQLIVGMMERDKERDRIRSEAEEQRRRYEADERSREWKERQVEAQAQREKELAEIKAQREREREEAKAQRDRDLAEFRARQEQTAAEAKARLDAQIEDMKEQSAARLEQMRLDAEVERDRRKMHLDAESRQLETKATGGLGFEGIGKIREMVAEAVGKAALKSAGIDDEEDDAGGIGGAIAETLRSEGPELIRKAADIFLPKIANWLPGPRQEAAPQQVPDTAARRLPPPGPAAPAAGVPDFSTAAAAEPEHSDVPDVDDAMPVAAPPAPQAAAGVPTKEIAARAATTYAFGAVFQFVRPLTVLALAQPEPDAAWDAQVGGDGQTLADFFRLMPKSARETAATDWPKFVAAVREASAADADLLADAVSQEGGAKWLEDFLAAGPWVPEEGETA